MKTDILLFILLLVVAVVVGFALQAAGLLDEPNDPNGAIVKDEDFWFAWDDVNDVTFGMYDNEPNLINLEEIEPNEPNEATDDEAGAIVFEVNEPNDNYVLFYSEAGSDTFDFNDMIAGDWYKAETVTFFLDNEDWAVFNRKRDGVVGCSLSQAEFLKDLPKVFSSMINGFEPNEPVIIEWSKKEKTNEPNLVSLEEYENNRLKFELVTELPCGIACPECGAELMENFTVVLTSNPPQYYVNCPKCEWSGTKH